MGKSTISMAIFNSYLYVYQRVMNSTSQKKRCAARLSAWESSLARWPPKAERSSARKTPGDSGRPPNNAKIMRFIVI